MCKLASTKSVAFSFKFLLNKFIAAFSGHLLFMQAGLLQHLLYRLGYGSAKWLTAFSKTFFSFLQLLLFSF
jgi:hypothetical protein